ncbi:uncharacterized protein ALTATR162_LOCUS190 [Alternaria atra]|uniref:Uncharacterized protein n=1 Tax=Alternaria atra TaxID=119953 RepID=A0A8J2HRI2_9PLEO|nr:uncharacterized protein ALTATR162_LOCUS190 [Alternaria atra]CAG5137742.1 unnamed protein product [Alternaria atra]
MAQHNQNIWRPRPRNSKYRAPKGSKWQDQHQKEDDQIAPDGVSGSTNHLELWALMTADMPQHPTKRAKSRAIEEEIQERIQRRYQGPKHHRPATSQNDLEPVDEHMVIDLTGEDVQSKALTPAPSKKRPHSPSPARDMLHTDLSTVSYVQTIKRRRSRSNSPKRSAYSAFSARTYDTRALSTAESDEEYDYAQSSEWSFPSSEDEDDEMT